MATQKPISTISYNTEPFLREKLETWLKAHIIQSYMYICHKGEDGDKDHIHLRIEPNKKLDPMDLTEQLKEYVVGNEKPLCCRPWRPSNEEDWTLYAVHDEEYLKIKYGGGEKGEKLPYDWKDVKVPDNYDMEVCYLRAKSKLKHTSANMSERMRQGEKPLSLIQQGENVYMVNAIMRALQSTDYNRLQDEINRQREENLKILQAVYDYGLDIWENQDGTYVVKPRGTNTGA